MLFICADRFLAMDLKSEFDSPFACGANCIHRSFRKYSRFALGCAYQARRNMCGQFHLHQRPKVDVITDDMNGGVNPGTCIQILEQPASQEVRFRYECEGRSAGSIPGVNSTPENKTYPKIKICGYKGRVVVLVSCVTKDSPYKPHPHKLVGRESCRGGVCTVEVCNETMTATFPNLGIQCIKRKDMVQALEEREKANVDPFKTGFSHKNHVNSIDLNVVRFCFQAFIKVNSKCVILPPVVSEPIYDKKAVSSLTICKLSHASASVSGDQEVILLCEKVTKDDIEVWMYEKNQSGDIIWQEKTEFQPQDVHKQVAIPFRTPPYKNLQVEEPVHVWIELRRPSDNATSDPRPFILEPVHPGRKRKIPKKSNGDGFNPYANYHEINAMDHAGVPLKHEPECSPYNAGFTFIDSSPSYAHSAHSAPRTPSPGQDYLQPLSQAPDLSLGASSSPVQMVDSVLLLSPPLSNVSGLNKTIDSSHQADGKVYMSPEGRHNDFNTSPYSSPKNPLVTSIFTNYDDYINPYVNAIVNSNQENLNVNGSLINHVDHQNVNYQNPNAQNQMEDYSDSLPTSLSNINISDYIPRPTDSNNSMLDSLTKYLDPAMNEVDQ